MSLIKWNGKPDPDIPTKLTEAMRNAEPKRLATEVMFSALDKAMTQFEHRKGVLEREIAERQTELSDLAVAMKAAGAGLSGLNADRQLTERLAAGMVDETPFA